MSFNTFVQQGQVIPNYLERKQILYRDPAFQPTTVLVLDTSNRNTGTISNPTWYLQTPIQNAYAISLKSMNIPVSWPNVLSAQTIQVTYGGGTFPTSITIPIGRYTYDPEVGTLTYATVSAAPASSFLDDLMYVIMRGFNGAIQSILINPATGLWTWTWNSSCVSVTSGSSSVTNFFKITVQSGLAWLSSSMVDLTGTKLLIISCSDLVTGGYLTSATQAQSYLCSCPVGNLQSGDLLSHAPHPPKVTWFGNIGKYIGNISLSILDAGTNQVLPLTADWTVELTCYADSVQM